MNLPAKAPITVQILTQNGEAYVRTCLESVQWAERVQVIDGGSTDRTVEIAREYTPHIYQNAYQNYGNQQNWGLNHAKHDWVLVVDSDEWVSPELQHEILALLAKGPDKNGYWIRRTSYFLGKKIRFSGWQNDLVLRFFNRTKGGFKVRNVHSDAMVETPVGQLRNVMYHAPYRNVTDYMARLQRYTTWGAQELVKQKKSITLLHVLTRPVARFFRGYLFRLGVLDGWQGFVLAFLTSTYVLVKYLKAYELQDPERFLPPNLSQRTGAGNGASGASLSSAAPSELRTFEEPPGPEGP